MRVFLANYSDSVFSTVAHNRNDSDMLASSAHSDGWDHEGQKLGSTAAIRI